MHFAQYTRIRTSETDLTCLQTFATHISGQQREHVCCRSYLNIYFYSGCQLSRGIRNKRNENSSLQLAPSRQHHLARNVLRLRRNHRPPRGPCKSLRVLSGRVLLGRVHARLGPAAIMSHTRARQNKPTHTHARSRTRATARAAASARAHPIRPSVRRRSSAIIMRAHYTCEVATARAGTQASRGQPASEQAHICAERARVSTQTINCF